LLFWAGNREVKRSLGYETTKTDGFALEKPIAEMRFLTIYKFVMTVDCKNLGKILLQFLPEYSLGGTVFQVR